MSIKNFQISCAVVLALLFLAQMSISFGKEYELLIIPDWAYTISIYLRSVSSIVCLFIGFYAVINKIKLGYSLITIGLLFGFLSVVPPIMALYFSKDIDMSVLSGNDLKTFKHTLKLQKLFLLFFVAFFIVTTAAYWVGIRKRHITKH